MSDLFGNHIVGFPTRWLICNVKTGRMKRLLKVCTWHFACADPEGGTGGPDPPWNLKILPKKR